MQFPWVGPLNHFSKNIFLGIGPHQDSISWLHDYVNFPGVNDNPILALWIHSHVRGTLCGFSSVDVHTQFAYRLISPNILGLVVQLDNSGQCEDFDFLQLSSAGYETVKQCGKYKNISSVQHDSCAAKDLFESAKHRISFNKTLSVKVQDYRSEKSRMSVDDQFDWNSCKNCQKDFKNILLHLSKVENCRKVYGTDYEKMQKSKSDKKKQYVKDYYRKNIDAIRKRKLDHSNAYREEINAKKRKCDKDHHEKRLEKHKIYNRENRTSIQKKQKLYNDANHFKISEKQTDYNQKHRKEIKKKQNVYNEKHREEINEKQGLYNDSNRDVITDKQRSYNQAHKEVINEKQTIYNKIKRKNIRQMQAKRRNLKKQRLNMEDRILMFRREIIEGPNFSCTSCERCLFRSGVKFIPEKDFKGLLEKMPPKFKEAVKLKEEPDYHLCHTCHKAIKKGKIPSISSANGLTLESIPEELKISDLEQQLIAKILIFMKIKKLPTTRMKAVFDRVISVPLENQDIEKTIQTLPRQPNDAEIVAVELKRKLELKNSHLREFIRPGAVVKAVKKLKMLKNPYYYDVRIDENFALDEDEEPEDDILEESNLGGAIAAIEVEDELLNEEELCNILSECESEKEHDSDDDDDDIETRLAAVKNYQGDYDSHTCLMPMDLDAQVVVNEGPETINKTKSENGKGISIAPGEGKVPTNFLREHNIDVKAFPRHFPTGNYGIDHKRELRLTKQMYFNQRLLNKDDRLATDPYYVFMATSYIERLQLEQQIDISGLKGISSNEGNGQTSLKLKDPCDIFKKLSGSPKFWQNARNELIAKVKQLGAFQIFFTFSCGEMRWVEMYITLFLKKGCKVEFICEDEWSGRDIDILVNDVPIWTFIENMPETRHEVFRNHTFLLTRMFDARVKSFVKNIIMGKGLDKVPIRHFSYRVEFQARGMPHIHGVAWVEKDWMKSHDIPDNLCDQPEKALILVEKMISCEFPEDVEVKKIVTEVQQHNHTKSCMKYNGLCRYGFPRLPSPKTLIAKPLPKEMPQKEKEALNSKACELLTKAKSLIQAENFDKKMTFQNYLNALGVKEEEYIELLSISSTGNVLVLKRSLMEIHTNNYNFEMLKAWNANMDIQIALDPYAVITYVVSYVLKDETGMTSFLKQALNSQTGKSVKEKINALKTAYLLNRQVGESESCYRILPGMRLKDSNISTIFIQTGFPENRTEFYKRIPDGSTLAGNTYFFHELR